MRSLRERLRGLHGTRAPQVTGPAAEAMSRRVQRLRATTGTASHTRSKGDTAALAEIVGGRQRGPGFLELDSLIPRGAWHGRVPLVALEGPLGGLTGSAGAVDLLILDTETTGLAGGSGTVAFLIGVARWRPAGLVMRQYLITEFAGEAYMLDALMQDVGEQGHLVTYNGKTFDLPLIATRCVLHRRDNRLARLAHSDLLQAVRRRFRGHWENCRQITAEQRLLGVTRRHDLPGSEAPEAWREYLQSGRGDRLKQVVAHNRQDLLGLAALLPGLATDARPAQETACGPADTQADLARGDCVARARLAELHRVLQAGGRGAGEQAEYRWEGEPRAS